MKSNFRVLVVDDEELILNFLRIKLRVSGYQVATARNGAEALELIKAQEPDLIVLDLIMPVKDGFEVLREVRSFSAVPVIILSARSADTDKIKGLGMGADDYLQKPFNPDELIARIETVRRRLAAKPQSTAQGLMSFDGTTIDFAKRIVMVDGQERQLSGIEWLLLNELALNIGHVTTYAELLEKVWGPGHENQVRTLRKWMSHLRGKVERDPNKPALIRSVSDSGYIMESLNSAS